MASILEPIAADSDKESDKESSSEHVSNGGVAEISPKTTDGENNVSSSSVSAKSDVTPVKSPNKEMSFMDEVMSAMGSRGVSMRDNSEDSTEDINSKDKTGAVTKNGSTSNSSTTSVDATADDSKKTTSKATSNNTSNTTSNTATPSLPIAGGKPKYSKSVAATSSSTPPVPSKPKLISPPPTKPKVKAQSMKLPSRTFKGTGCERFAAHGPSILPLVDSISSFQITYDSLCSASVIVAGSISGWLQLGGV